MLRYRRVGKRAKEGQRTSLLFAWTTQLAIIKYHHGTIVQPPPNFTVWQDRTGRASKRQDKKGIIIPTQGQLSSAALLLLFLPPLSLSSPPTTCTSCTCPWSLFLCTFNEYLLNPFLVFPSLPAALCNLFNYANYIVWEAAIIQIADHLSNNIIHLNLQRW